MFSLAPYRISIQKDGSTQKLAFANNRSALGQWFHSVLASLSKNVIDLPDKKMLRVERLAANADCTFICATIHTGEYGFESRLFDSKESTVKHKRTVTEAELIPFFVSIVLPKDAEWGVLMLQRFKNFGIRDFIAPGLQARFEATHHAKLQIERLVPSTFVQQLYKDGLVKTMRFVRYSMPDDIANALGKDVYTPHVQEVELVVKAKRKHALPKLGGITDLLDGTKNFSDVVSIKDWDYDTIKLEMEFGGRRRTIEVDKPFKATPNLDITENVAVGADGHPVWDDLVSEAAQFSVDLLSHADFKLKLDTDLINVVDAAPLPATTVVAPDYFEVPPAVTEDLGAPA
ncbi:hypothetical protein [Paraburkholderia unamae]|uniref:Uncharacterized protein n=1 Tax=Paraburkholderia unamae TaxID=219649 RepID=A0ACC6RU14_9BURK